jgi:phenylpropionate dioxygenase-like ring-hydroxylating dioxygenase large terminal subunit
MNHPIANQDAIDRELSRTSYPENFPALPELPVGRYTDPEFYDLEMKYLWRKSWLQVGHVSEVSEPGAYKLFEEVGLSVIISRGLNGELRTFHNICRHRGSPLLLEPKGTARRFLCPYHSWNYNLDGSMAVVPRQEDFACLEKTERGLLPVRVEVMRGLIFINLDPNAESLDTHLAPTERDIGEYALQDMVVKDSFVVEMDCNWKTAYDNFMEIYHVNSVHVTSIAPFLDSKSFTVSLYKNGHARFMTRKKQGEDSLYPSELKIQKTTAELFSKHTLALPIFPNSFTPLDPVGYSQQSWWPAGPSKTRMAIMMMGWKDDSEADKKFWANMRDIVHSVVAEDARLFGGIQRSLDSGLLPTTMLSCQERMIYWYHEEIDRVIGAEKIPAHLRMKPLLGEFVSE